MNNKIVIESLSMDLYRVAIGYHRKSIKLADRFCQEVLLRINEVDKSTVKPYFAQMLIKIPVVLSEKDIERKAEDALMYSILCKNYAKKFEGRKK